MSENKLYNQLEELLKSKKSQNSVKKMGIYVLKILANDFDNSKWTFISNSLKKHYEKSVKKFNLITNDNTIEDKYIEDTSDSQPKTSSSFSQRLADSLNFLNEYIDFKLGSNGELKENYINWEKDEGANKPLYKIKDEKIEEVQQITKTFFNDFKDEIKLILINDDEINLKQVIDFFIDKWDKTEDLWKISFFENTTQTFGEYKLKISYGKGKRITLPKYPYIAFLKGNNKVSKGIHPYISYIHNEKKLEIGLGISKDNVPEYNKELIEELENVQKHKFKLDEIDLLIEKLKKNIKYFDELLLKYEQNKGKNNMPNDIKKIQPLNQILYGSPGTGYVK